MTTFFENEQRSLPLYEEPKWGFYITSEIINGRIAMIALVLLIIVEILTKKSIFAILYLRN